MEKALRGYEKQVQEHIDKIASPAKYAERWKTMIEAEQNGLLRKWANDQTRNQELADVMKGILQERGK